MRQTAMPRFFSWMSRSRQLKPGFYTCQVNVVDDAGGHFLFPAA